MVVLASGLVIGIIVLVASAMPVALFRRCRKVDAVRSERLRQIYDQAASDMSGGESWEWRFDTYRTGPSFTEMVWKIWRPVSSFYGDQQTRVR